jgi:hypothetical protein
MHGEAYETLLEVRDRPHLLDDDTVARFLRLIADELEFLPVYREQLARWYQAGPTSGQVIELDRVTRQLDRWSALLGKQQALAQEISAGTIEKVMAKGDLELGIETLQRISRSPATK